MSDHDNDKPPTELFLSLGYTLSNSMLYYNGSKCDSAGIRVQIKDDGSITTKYIVAQYNLWGCMLYTSNTLPRDGSYCANDARYLVLHFSYIKISISAEALSMQRSWIDEYGDPMCDWVNQSAISLPPRATSHICPGTAMVKPVPCREMVAVYFRDWICGGVPLRRRHHRFSLNASHHSTGSLGTLYLGSDPLLSDANEFIFFATSRKTRQEIRRSPTWSPG